jgi:hypothetical protein
LRNVLGSYWRSAFLKRISPHIQKFYKFAAFFEGRSQYLAIIPSIKETFIASVAQLVRAADL